MKTIELLLNENIMNKFSPSHYQRGKIQVWDFIADQELDFFAGNVIKYVCRAGHKDQEGEPVSYTHLTLPTKQMV